MSENEIKEQLLNLVVKFMENNRITCEDTIYQCDWVIENAYAFIEDLFKTVEPLLELED